MEKTMEITVRDLANHLGHELKVVHYGENGENISLECETCGEVLIDTDNWR